MMLFWFVIIGVLLFLLLRDNSNLSFASKNAENTLDERLANGEISIEEYKEIKKALKENN